MTGPRHSSSSGEFARSAGGATARGLIVVLVAVAVGVFLLARGLDDPLAVAVEADGGSPATDTTAAGGGDDTATSTSTAAGSETTIGGDTITDDSTATTGEGGTTETSELAAARPPSQVKVQVANASRVPGAAGTETQSLQALGYATGTPTNYTGPEILDTSRLHYRLGFLLEAQNLATALNLDPAADVFPMDGELPIEKADEDPDVVLLLGRDLAAPEG